MSKYHSIVIFANIRGFTSATEKTAFNDVAQKFICDFLELRDRHFDNTNAEKMTGEGFMLAYDIDPGSRTDKLNSILSSAEQFTAEFNNVVEAVSGDIATDVNFDLGWGISRGVTYETGDRDRFGSIINIAAHLCDCARPHGFVISAEHFKERPGHTPDGTWHQTNQFIPGYNTPHKVWESNTPHQEVQSREHRKESPEVHVAGTCIRKSGDKTTILLIRRSQKRKLFKGLWDGCGGQLRYSETFGEGIARHFLTELNVAVRPFETIHRLYNIREPNEPVIPGLRILCEHISGEPYIEPNYSESRWVTLDELKAMNDAEFMPGFKEQAVSLVGEFLWRHLGKSSAPS